MMQDQSPSRVTTIIPAFNAAAHIRRAIDSALAQNISAAEIVVVDDCSQDSTADIVKGYGEPVRLVQHQRNCGASSARNTGIANARGVYVAFLDADDEWLPEKLSKQLQIMDEAPTMVLVACRARIIDPAGRDTGDAFRGLMPETGENTWKTLLAHTFLATPCVVARRSALNEAGPFNPSLQVGEDQDMWIRLALLGTVGFVDEVLVRVHSGPRGLSTMRASERAAFVMPMIGQHIRELRHRLSDSEIRHVMGERLAKFGRQAYAEGDYRAGFSLLAGAISRGHHPIENLLHLMGAFSAKYRIQRFMGSRSEENAKVTAA